MAISGNRHMDDSRSYKEFIDGSDHEERQKAMADEIRTINEEIVWSPAELPTG